ncbi:hypothetical protein PPS11_09370 [Pseudomonas putida S11]|nr:hypothetical protein PPS11_09370 [Pseudomonas putida S11]
MVNARVQVTALEEIVELRFPFVEFGDVGSGEVAARRVQQLDVAVIDDDRTGVVQRRLAVVVALEQFHHIEAGDDLVAVRLQAVPFVGGRRIAAEREAAQADHQRQGGAWEEMLHADSTWRQLITHSRPSFLFNRLQKTGCILQKAWGLGVPRLGHMIQLWRHCEGIARR